MTISEFMEQTIQINCEVCNNRLKKRSIGKNRIYVRINLNCKNYWVRSRYSYVVNIKKVFGEVL